MNRIDRTQEAAEWLAERLSDGPVPRTTLTRESAALGIPRTTLARAADRLAAVSEPLPVYPRRTTWRLP